MQRWLAKAWKRYYLNRLKKKKEDLDVQTAETIDKAPILNLFEILQQITFLDKDQHDDDKINCLLILFASLLHYKYTVSSNLYMKK